MFMMKNKEELNKELEQCYRELDKLYQTQRNGNIMLIQATIRSIKEELRKLDASVV